jgi:hypothetical protein
MLKVATLVDYTAQAVAVVAQGKTTPAAAAAVAQVAQVRAASSSSSPTSNLTNHKK